MSEIFSEGLWNNYREKLGHIESTNNYSAVGGKNDHYDGRYQFGAIAKKDLGLGHTKKEREAFRKDSVAQEKALLDFTKLNYNRLMKDPNFAGMSTDQQMGTLAYAHNQGASGAKKWLKTGVSGKDGFGTYGTKYYKAFTDKNPAVNASSKPKPRPEDIAPPVFAEVPELIAASTEQVPPMNTSLRPQMRPTSQSAEPLSVEQAVMSASVPEQQVYLSPPPIINYMDNKKTGRYNQGTSEVVPRLYADGTSYVDYFKNLFKTNYQPVPGDMRGSPQGFAGLSDQQISQSFNEMNADRSAFNPVAPAYVPQPGDMLGYPKGQFRNSLGQMVQAAQENRADMSAFNPVVPPLVPDPRNLGGAEGYGSLGFAPINMDNYALLSESDLALLASRGDDAAIEQQKLNEIKRSQEQDQMSSPVIDPINLETPILAPIDAIEARVYGAQETANSIEDEIIKLENISSTLGGSSVVDDEIESLKSKLEKENKNLEEAKIAEAEAKKRIEVPVEVVPAVPTVKPEDGPAVKPKDKPAVKPEDPADVRREIALNDMNQVTDPDGKVVKMPGEEEANSFGTTMSELGGKLGPIFKSLFGLENQDMIRALGFYLVSRLSGASHAGSMRWAGTAVLKQSEQRRVEEKSLSEQKRREDLAAEIRQEGYDRDDARYKVTDALAAAKIAATLKGNQQTLQSDIAKAYNTFRTTAEDEAGDLFGSGEDRLVNIPSNENISRSAVSWGQNNGYDLSNAETANDFGILYGQALQAMKQEAASNLDKKIGTLEGFLNQEQLKAWTAGTSNLWVLNPDEEDENKFEYVGSKYIQELQLPLKEFAQKENSTGNAIMAKLALEWAEMPAEQKRKYGTAKGRNGFYLFVKQKLGNT